MAGMGGILRAVCRCDHSTGYLLPTAKGGGEQSEGRAPERSDQATEAKSSCYHQSQAEIKHLHFEQVYCVLLPGAGPCTCGGMHGGVLPAEQCLLLRPLWTHTKMTHAAKIQRALCPSCTPQIASRPRHSTRKTSHSLQHTLLRVPFFRRCLKAHQSQQGCFPLCR